MRILTFLGAVLCASPTLAQDVDCTGDALVQYELNFCAKQTWQVADDALNAAYKIAQAEAQRRDEDLPSDQIPSAKMLLDTQRLWIGFRDKACETEETKWRGGSASPMIYWGCMTRLTSQRTDDLTIFSETY